VGGAGREWGSMDLVSFDATDVASFKTNDLSSFHLTDLPFFWMHLMLLALSCVDANARGCRGLCCQLVGSTCTDHADLVCSGGALLVVTTQRIPLFVCAHDFFWVACRNFLPIFPTFSPRRHPLRHNIRDCDVDIFRQSYHGCCRSGKHNCVSNLSPCIMFLAMSEEFGRNLLVCVSIGTKPSPPTLHTEKISYFQYTTLPCYYHPPFFVITTLHFEYTEVVSASNAGSALFDVALLLYNT